jgi:hypothetical protein
MKRTLVTALIAAPCLLALSYPWRDASQGVGALLSGIGWLGFMVSLLVIVVISVVLGVRRFRTG